VSSPTRAQGPGEWNAPGRAAEPCDRARPGRAPPLRRPAAARRQRVQRETCIPYSARSQPHPARRAVCQRQPTLWAQARGLAVPHLRGEARPRADGRAWPGGGAQPPAPSQAPGPHEASTGGGRSSRELPSVQTAPPVSGAHGVGGLQPVRHRRKWRRAHRPAPSRHAHSERRRDVP
jgi:hypothetical protein